MLLRVKDGELDSPARSRQLGSWVRKEWIGSSLAVEWLGFSTFTAVAWVQSLVQELRSHIKPRYAVAPNQKKKKKKKKKTRERIRHQRTTRWEDKNPGLEELGIPWSLTLR